MYHLMSVDDKDAFERASDIAIDRVSILYLLTGDKTGDKTTALLSEYFGALSRVQHIQRRLVRSSSPTRKRMLTWLSWWNFFTVLDGEKHRVAQDRTRQPYLTLQNFILYR